MLITINLPNYAQSISTKHTFKKASGLCHVIYISLLSVFRHPYGNELEAVMIKSFSACSNWSTCKKMCGVRYLYV